jgi:hypothetical protein
MASIIKVDKLDPQSGTALEIGTSGDTVTVPTGVGLTLTDATLLLPTTINTDKIDPKSGTALEIGTSGDTITVPTGAGLTVTDEVKTNKISPATGTAFAMGDSGDTFTIPSGATIVNSGTATGFGSSDYVKLSTVTAAADTNVEFDGFFSATYDYYKIFCRFVPSAAGTLNTTFNRSGTAVTTSDYNYLASGGEGFSGSANNSQSIYAENQAAGIVVGNTAGDIDGPAADGVWGCILNIDLYDPLGTTLNPTIFLNETHYSSNGGRYINTAGNVSLVDNIFTGISGINLYPSTGNITGMFSLYGLKP